MDDELGSIDTLGVRSIVLSMARSEVFSFTADSRSFGVRAILPIRPNDAFRNNRCDACYTAAVEFMKTMVIPVVAYVLGTGSARGSLLRDASLVR